MEKIEFNQVSYSSKKISYLDSVSFTVEKGDLFIIKSDSPESHHILDLVRQAVLPNKGSVCVHKEDKDFIGTNMGPFIRGFTVAQMLSLPLLAKNYSKQERAKKIDHISKYFTIDSILQKDISSCTEEERALVGISKAVIAEPSILLLKEFSSSLEHKFAVLVMTYLHELSVDYNVTILLTENDTKLHPFASKILYLEKAMVKDIVGEGVDIERLVPFLKI